MSTEERGKALQEAKRVLGDITTEELIRAAVYIDQGVARIDGETEPATDEAGPKQLVSADAWREGRELFGGRNLDGDKIQQWESWLRRHGQDMFAQTRPVEETQG